MEIHKQIVAVYGNIMNQQNVTKWCREFSEGRADVHYEQRSGRPSLISGWQQTFMTQGLNKCLDNIWRLC
jgi:transposase